MKAWVINGISNLSTDTKPLEMVQLPVPVPQANEILLKVRCCGVCHTELDEIEGRTPPPAYPIVPGHQVIGLVDKVGPGVTKFKIGDRVGVAWIYSACGQCEYCRSGLENLCQDFVATGRDHHGGYSEYMVVQEQFSYLVPSLFSDLEAAPLLCAGAIGYRSLKLTMLTDGDTLGLTGFGASGHLVLKMARYLYPRTEIFVFARNKDEQSFARALGAAWAGDISETPPARGNAIIDTTPAWATVTGSLLSLKPGGRLVINAIRKEANDLDALLKIRYQDHLWMEKEIKTVANITRSDVMDFLDLAASIPIKPVVEPYPFELANKALLDLRHKHIKGAKVLVVSER